MHKRATRDREFEYLDDPNLAPDIAAQSLRDIALSNKLFGGTRALLAEMRLVFRELKQRNTTSATLLDVGTGLGDIPLALAAEAKRYNIRMTPVGLEITESMAAVARQRARNVVTGDARRLPFADRSIDVITCSLVLHHLEHDDAVQMLRECNRVARTRVIVADLERAKLPVALLWLVSFPLRFHPISRHDGMVSIRRGYTIPELRELLAAANIDRAHCQRRLGWRVTASWQPGTKSS